MSEEYLSTDDAEEVVNVPESDDQQPQPAEPAVEEVVEAADEEPQAPSSTPVAEVSAGDEAVAEQPEPAPVEPPVTEQVASDAPPDQSAVVAEEPVAAAGEEPVQDYEKSFPQLEKGELIKGTVVHIDREGVLVDVGAKSEGIIKPGELSRDETVPAEDVVKVGEEIDVVVLEAESADGTLLLSKKKADFEKAWDRVIEAKETGKIICAMVTDRVKGGLVVDLGIRGFVPASHVGTGSPKANLEKYVGQSLPLKVLEVDKERRKVVLSHKLADQEGKEERRKRTLETLKVGEVRHGTVRRLTDYGAFVDIGGVDGLLHISEMSWTRINHPSDVLKEGQEIDVMVLKLDRENGKVSLGLRQILPDPWTEIEREYHVGDIITGTVARIVPFGVFVQVKGGVEGIIPNSELSYRKGVKAQDMVQIGETIEIKVIDMRPDERKLTLSLRQARHEEETRRERSNVEQHQTRIERDIPRYTIGDAIKDKDKGEND